MLKKMPHKEKYLQDHISYCLVNGTEILAWARKSGIMYFRAKTVSSLTTDLFALPPIRNKADVPHLLAQRAAYSAKLVVPHQGTPHVGLQGRRGGLGAHFFPSPGKPS